MTRNAPARQGRPAEPTVLGRLRVRAGALRLRAGGRTPRAGDRVLV